MAFNFMVKKMDHTGVWSSTSFFGSRGSSLIVGGGWNGGVALVGTTRFSPPSLLRARTEFASGLNHRSQRAQEL